MIVLHYDWLQLSFHGDPRAIPFGYQFKRLEGSNKIFSRLGHICTSAGTPIAVVQYAPVSNLMRKDLITLKFENYTLYNGEWRNLLHDLLYIFQWSLIGITRLDICGDMQQLSNGASPASLISDLFCGDVIKLNRRAEVFYNADKRAVTSMYTTKYKGLAVYLTSDIHANSGYVTGYRTGSRSSAVCAYLYNKSLELKMQTDKPYIRDCWDMMQYDSGKDVWRLEFSIKGKAYRNLSAEDLLRGSFINELWRKMLDEYFILKNRENGILDIIPAGSQPAPIIRRERGSDATRSAKLLVARLAKEAAASPKEIAVEIVNVTLLIASQHDIMKYAEAKLNGFHVLSLIL